MLLFFSSSFSRVFRRCFVSCLFWFVVGELWLCMFVGVFGFSFGVFFFMCMYIVVLNFEFVFVCFVVVVSSRASYFSFVVAYLILYVFFWLFVCIVSVFVKFVVNMYCVGRDVMMYDLGLLFAKLFGVRILYASSFVVSVFSVVVVFVLSGFCVVFGVFSLKFFVLFWLIVSLFVMMFVWMNVMLLRECLSGKEIFLLLCCCVLVVNEMLEVCVRLSVYVSVYVSVVRMCVCVWGCVGMLVCAARYASGIITRVNRVVL